MRELSESAREKLAGPSFAYVATVKESGAPHVAPVWVDLEGDRIAINTLAGSVKERNLRRDPRVALTVSDRRVPYDKLDVRGRALAFAQGDEAARHMHALARKYTGREYPYATDGLVKVVIEPEGWYEEDYPELSRQEAEHAAKRLASASEEVRDAVVRLLRSADRTQLVAVADLLAAARDEDSVRAAAERLG